MRVKIYTIEKKSREVLYEPLVEHYKKIAKTYAKIEVNQIFSREIAKAQEASCEIAQMSYTKAFEKHIQASKYSIILDPLGDEVDSFEFAEILKDRAEISFFIGGAYGFERTLLKKSNKVVSFGKITLSHKLVKVILMEQIFRGLSINHNHPYHK